MDLTTVWFVAIALLWIGYFVLEGFDFGVGMLLPILGRTDRQRRLLINTIGPVWDGNEVWVLVAAGAMFAAFPEWYATMFSGFYLPLLLILLTLIVRGVAFDYRGKRDELRWKARWDLCIIAGSLAPAFIWGVAFTNLVRGLPIDADGEYVGGLLNLMSPVALLGGLLTVTLFLTHGAVFVALKTTGQIRDDANRLARRVGVVCLVVLITVMCWLEVVRGNRLSLLFGALAVAGLAAGILANLIKREGLAFAGTALAIAALFAALFSSLFPDLMPSSLNPAWSLTTANASSTPYTLTIMTWSAAIGLPLVIGYQAWTYWVFRKRLSLSSIPADASSH